MPTLAAALDFAKYEGRSLRGHQLGAAPSSPVTGQIYYNTGDNTLYWWDGTTWVSARGGASSTPPATTGSLGTIQLAGDLAGTATSPQIAAGVITDTEVAAANKDGVAGTASLRTLGLGAQQALAGTTRLDQIAVPTADVAFNGRKITGLADGVNPTDAATKGQVDLAHQGLNGKDGVRAATTANITLSAPQTIDGVAVVANDRVLVKNQTTTSANGIYLVAAGAWTRTTDFDAWAEVPGAYVFVEVGTTQADTGWLSTADQGGVLGTTAIPWVQFSAAGQILAGAGMTKTGVTLDVVAGNTSLTVAADNVVVNTAVIAARTYVDSQDLLKQDAATASGYYSALLGAGTAITVTKATHGLRASRGLVVQVQEEATGLVVLPDVAVAATGDVTVTFGAAVSASAYRITVVG